MVNGIRTSDPRRLNNGRCSEFRAGFPVQQTPEEGWMTYRPRRCEYKDEDNSLITQNDKNDQASSQEFRQ